MEKQDVEKLSKNGMELVAVAQAWLSGVGDKDDLEKRVMELFDELEILIMGA
jgi:hypothetical protein